MLKDKKKQFENTKQTSEPDADVIQVWPLSGNLKYV